MFTSASDSCTTLPLRTGYQADRPCDCAPTIPVLNCAGTMSDLPPPTLAVRLMKPYVPLHSSWTEDFASRNITGGPRNAALIAKEVPYKRPACAGASKKISVFTASQG